MTRGKIIRGVGGFYYVHTGGGTILTCRARGLFRKNGVKPLVGDWAEVEESAVPDGEANVVRIFPRKNALIRPAVSNVDLVIPVQAVRTPDPQLYLLDQYLVNMEKQDLPAALLFTKADLDRDGALAHLTAIYRSAGYRVLAVSAETGEGIDALRDLIRGKTAVLAGPSGAGKSTLTNLLCPLASMATGELSRKISRGKQTTRHAELFPVEEGTYLLDTPGFTSVFVDAEADELRLLFPEMREREGSCRFTGCRHLTEPGCAVKRDLAGGLIARERYESYQKLMKELSERRQY